MKKIITAIGNQNVNQNLRRENIFEILAQDIPYKEGILEFLEQKEVDFLILSELLPGEIELKELIEKVKADYPNTQIILFLEKKNQELESYLYTKGIYSIFYHNQLEIAELAKLIKQEEQSKSKMIQQELEELKQWIMEKEKNDAKEKKKKITSETKNKNTTENRVFCISGTSGVGKSIFSINLAKSFMETKYKILIIDFDVLNNSLHTILGIKKYPEKVANKIKNNNLLEPLKVDELIMKINSHVDLIAGVSLLFDSQYQISKLKIKTILSQLKQLYDVIVIDTSSECFLDYTKEIMKYSSTNIFLVEANLIEIKKAKKLLNIYINQWELIQNQIHIIFNKYNENAIDDAILKNIFSGFPILGKITNSSKYNLLIDKNDKNSLENDLQKEYRNIQQKLKSHLEDKTRRSLWKKYWEKKITH